MLSVSRLLTGNCTPANILTRAVRVAQLHIDVKHVLLKRGRESQCLWCNKNASLFLINTTSRFSSTGINPVLEGQKVVGESDQNDISSHTVNLSDVSSSTPIIEKQQGSDSVVSPEVVEQPIEPIPEPPPVVELPVENVLEVVGGEPTFASIGLGGWGPIGIIQNCFEFLHISCSLPWWTTIVIGTIVVRVLMFPLVIIAQRNAAKMNNHLPQIQVLQLKMTEARERGDRLDAARYAQEMMLFMQEKKLNPFKNMLVPLAQAPLFISFFVGLREMSNLPVESMKTGGLFWFTDLTVPDEFYLLPLITSATLALTIEIGTDAGRLQSANLGLMKYFLRAMPIVIFPFTINFSSGILVYWCSTNFISLCQVAVLKIPTVRDYFKIEKLVVHNKNELPIKDKGFVKGVSDSWTNMKLSRELEERERIDNINFTRAGRGPVKKTYRYDPTKATPPRTIPIQAKKRD